MHYYTLDKAGNPQLEPDIRTWAHWFENAQLHVADDHENGVRVSTVFIGWSPNSVTPTLWETAVFGGTLDGVKDRCGGTRVDALMMHRAMLERVRSFQRP